MRTTTGSVCLFFFLSSLSDSQCRSILAMNYVNDPSFEAQWGESIFQPQVPVRPVDGSADPLVIWQRQVEDWMKSLESSMKVLSEGIATLKNTVENLSAWTNNHEQRMQSVSFNKPLNYVQANLSPFLNHLVPPSYDGASSPAVFQAFEIQVKRHLKALSCCGLILKDKLASVMVRSWCKGTASALLDQLDLEGVELVTPEEILSQLKLHLVAPLDGRERRAALMSLALRKGESVSSFVDRFRSAAVGFPGTPAEVWSYFLSGVGTKVAASLRSALQFAPCPEGSGPEAHKFIKGAFAKAQSLAIAKEYEDSWTFSTQEDPMEVDVFYGRPFVGRRFKLRGPRCYNCNGRGHFADVCTSPNPRKKSLNMKEKKVKRNSFKQELDESVPVELVAFGETGNSPYAYQAELKGKEIKNVTSLADCGASHNIMRSSTAKKLGLEIKELGKIQVSGFDGMPSSQPKKIATVPTRIGGLIRPVTYLVLDCVAWEIILGRPWFRDIKPTFNWATGSLQLPGQKMPLRPIHKKKKSHNPEISYFVSSNCRQDSFQNLPRSLSTGKSTKYDLNRKSCYSETELFSSKSMKSFALNNKDIVFRENLSGKYQASQNSVLFGNAKSNISYSGNLKQEKVSKFPNNYSSVLKCGVKLQSLMNQALKPVRVLPL